MAASMEYHGPTPKPDGSGITRHMHLLLYPADWQNGPVKGTVSIQNDIIVTIDGAEGHWHFPVEQYIAQAITDSQARKEATNG